MGGDGQQRCHGSSTAGPRVDQVAQAWAAVSRPPTRCQGNCHLSNREVAEQLWVLTHVEALALTGSVFTHVFLPMDDDLRQSYRSVATPWELRFSRLFQ